MTRDSNNTFWAVLLAKSPFLYTNLTAMARMALFDRCRVTLLAIFFFYASFSQFSIKGSFQRAPSFTYFVWIGRGPSPACLHTFWLIKKRCAIIVSYSLAIRYCTSYVIPIQDAHYGWVGQHENNDTICTAVTLINMSLFIIPRLHYPMHVCACLTMWQTIYR